MPSKHKKKELETKKQSKKTSLTGSSSSSQNRHSMKSNGQTNHIAIKRFSSQLKNSVLSKPCSTKVPAAVANTASIRNPIRKNNNNTPKQKSAIVQKNTSSLVLEELVHEAPLRNRPAKKTTKQTTLKNKTSSVLSRKKK